MNVQIINKSKHQIPAYETEGSAGMDLRANIEESIIRVFVTIGNRIAPI